MERGGCVWGDREGGWGGSVAWRTPMMRICVWRRGVGGECVCVCEDEEDVCGIGRWGCVRDNEDEKDLCRRWCGGWGGYVRSGIRRMRTRVCVGEDDEDENESGWSMYVFRRNLIRYPVQEWVTQFESQCIVWGAIVGESNTTLRDRGWGLNSFPRK
jgi:hypothetical protein